MAGFRKGEIMKKRRSRLCCISSAFIVIILLTIACGTGCEPSVKTEEYLRIHVRANSNDEEDQRVKYLVRDAVVSYLTPYAAECRTKEEAIKTIGSKANTLRAVADAVLRRNGFSYSSSVTVRNEKFPTRTYEGTTLPSGYYDALIIGLGEAKGDNWWCVVYPPLCFLSDSPVEYRSKIAEIIERFKRKK